MKVVHEVMHSLSKAKQHSSSPQTTHAPSRSSSYAGSSHHTIIAAIMSGQPKLSAANYRLRRSVSIMCGSAISCHARICSAPSTETSTEHSLTSRPTLDQSTNCPLSRT